MFDTIVIATDGSDSVRRAVDVAVDVAARFDAEVHAVYVVDSGEVESTPDEVRDDLRDALDDRR
jgi:Universal stress protein family.